MIRYFFKVVIFVYERKNTVFCFSFEETSYLLHQKNTTLLIYNYLEMNLCDKDKEKLSSIC